MERNAETLDAIADSIAALPNKARQFFAGVSDQVARLLKTGLQALERIDLTGLGQRVGAFVNVAIDQIRNGRLAEFLKLSIEAGFEMGAQAGRQALERVRDWLGSPGFWSVIGTGFITFVNGVTKVLARAVELPVRLAVAALRSSLLSFKQEQA